MRALHFYIVIHLFILVIKNVDRIHSMQLCASFRKLTSVIGVGRCARIHIPPRRFGGINLGVRLINARKQATGFEQFGVYLLVAWFDNRKSLRRCTRTPNIISRVGWT